MALSAKIAGTVNRPFDEVAEHFGRLLAKQTLAGPVFHVAFSERLRLANDRRLLIVFGATGPWRGSTVMSFLSHAARHVPFFIRLEEIDPTTTRVAIHSGGSETLIGTDFGRNEGVLRSLVKGFGGAFVPIESG